MSRIRPRKENDVVTESITTIKQFSNSYQKKFPSKKNRLNSPYKPEKNSSKNMHGENYYFSRHRFTSPPPHKENNANNRSLQTIKTVKLTTPKLVHFSTPKKNKNLMNEQTANILNKNSKKTEYNSSLKYQDKDLSINIDFDQINNRLNQLETRSILEGISSYFEVFDYIIENDALYGKILKKIRSGFNEWKKYSDESLDSLGKLKKQLEEKESIINEMVIEKKHLFSYNVESQHVDYQEASSYSSNLQYKFIPEDKWNSLNYDIQNYADKIKDLEAKLEKYCENEKKYSNLISALKNRGYPVEEVYKTDILWFVDDINTKTKLSPLNEIEYLKTSRLNKESLDLISSSSSSI